MVDIFYAMSRPERSCFGLNELLGLLLESIPVAASEAERTAKLPTNLNNRLIEPTNSVSGSIKFCLARTDLNNSFKKILPATQAIRSENPEERKAYPRPGKWLALLWQQFGIYRKSTVARRLNQADP